MKRLLTVSTFLLIVLLSACLANGPTTVENRATPWPTKQALPTKTPAPTLTPIPTVVEPGLAYGRPCKAPCFWGLIPGQSTTEDIPKAAEAIRASGWAAKVDEDLDSLTVRLSPFSMDEIWVDAKNGVIRTVYGVLLFDYTVGDMVRQFGNPEGVYPAIKGSTREKSCPEQPGAYLLGESWGDSSVYLLYPSQGLVFIAGVTTSVRGLLCPGVRIDGFVYHAPLSMSVALENHYLADLFASPELGNITEQDLIQWHGYGGGY